MIDGTSTHTRGVLTDFSLVGPGPLAAWDDPRRSLSHRRSARHRRDGEFYRADDLKLEHTVAFKFLTEALTSDPTMLARFTLKCEWLVRSRMSVACMTSAMSKGAHFISMDYIEGEDPSLLRRIGRLPAGLVVIGIVAGLLPAKARGADRRGLLLQPK